jgi:hypothetical protein
MVINQVQGLDYSSLVCQVKDLGFRAMEVIREFGRGKIGVETFVSLMKSLPAEELLSQYWHVFMSDPKSAPCMEILQIIATLAKDSEYQLHNYGTASFLEDLQELMQRVKALG